MSLSNSIMVSFMAIIVFIVSQNWRTNVVGMYAKADCKAKGQDMTVEDRARFAPLVMHTLAVYTNPADLDKLSRTYPYSAHFWFISVYKGAEQLARYFNVTKIDDSTVYNIHDR